jgi:hypothetical protein
MNLHQRSLDQNASTRAAASPGGTRSGALPTTAASVDPSSAIDQHGVARDELKGTSAGTSGASVSVLISAAAAAAPWDERDQVGVAVR